MADRMMNFEVIAREKSPRFLVAEVYADDGSIGSRIAYFTNEGDAREYVTFLRTKYLPCD